LAYLDIVSLMSNIPVFLLQQQLPTVNFHMLLVDSYSARSLFENQPFKAFYESLFNDPQDVAKRSFHYNVQPGSLFAALFSRSPVILF